MNRVTYYLHLIPALLLQIFVFKTKTYYEDDLRQNKRIKGSAIIISNHRSFMDGLVIALRFFFKRLHFIATDFYKNRKFSKFIMRVSGGIFVDNEVNSFDFIEKGRIVTAKGRAIMVFPEGGHKHTYEPSKFFTGYIMLAIKTGAKIIPIVNDFNYGLFKRVHLMVGNSIDLSGYTNTELTRAKFKEINEEIYNKFLTLFYELKKKKAKRFLFKYEFIQPKPGDVIRVDAGPYCHYGVYFNANEVIQFGYAVNKAGENVVVNSISLNDFCGAKIPEVRILKKRFKRKPDDIEKYAKSCLGQGGYSMINNNCFDFVNRVTLNI